MTSRSPQDVHPAGDEPPAGVRVEVDGPIATVTLDRPAVLNAQTPRTWTALRDIGSALSAGIRVVVLRGEGRAFSAGLDLAHARENLGELAAVPPEEAESRIAEFQQGFSWLRRNDIVSIAVVRGHAIGAGFQLALGCDLRVLADDAMLCMREPSLGLVPDLMGTKPLVDIVGLPRALELCLTGRSVPAGEARELRLAELVVPVADLDGAVADLTAALLAVDPQTATATKALLARAQGNTLEQQAAAERQAQAALLRSRLTVS